MTVQKSIILFGIVLLSCTADGAIEVLDSSQPPKPLAIQVGPQPNPQAIPVNPQPNPTGPVNPQSNPQAVPVNPQAITVNSQPNPQAIPVNPKPNPNIPINPQPNPQAVPVNPQPTPTVPINPAPVLPVFDVTAFGAKADGKTDSFGAFVKTWNKACEESAVPSKVVIPAGNFMVGQVMFAGPCKSQITLEVLGNVLADTNPEDYPTNEWILFQDITGLAITGPGIFDGQGALLWPSTNCDLANTVECAPAPTSLKFDKVNNVVINGITSLNPKQFHFVLSDCNNFEASGIKLTAARDSPHTVGFSVTASQQVKISNTIIGTGGNCFNIAPGSTVSQVNVNCVFGH